MNFVKKFVTMPTLLRDRYNRSPFWYASFAIKQPDGTLKWVQRSTKTTDKAQALEIMQTWVKAAAVGNKMTPERAREVIARGVASVMELSGSEVQPETTTEQWCRQWLKMREVELAEASHSRYSLGIETFLRFLAPYQLADKDIARIRSKHFLDFRDWCVQRISVGSTNTHLRVLRACFNAAMRAGLVTTNECSKVSFIRSKGESRRRALTADEIRKVLEVCGDTPWRGLVLVGLYTGQRLSDCARLIWGQIELHRREIRFVTQKTGKRLTMRIAEPLQRYLESLDAPDRVDAFVFPTLAEKTLHRASALSNAFATEVLIPAGLMVPRRLDKKSAGKGRSGKRQVNEVTFHSLRHSFVTMLRATGASEAMAQMIVGHDSIAISRQYSHLSARDTEDSIAKLPDFTG